MHFLKHTCGVACIAAITAGCAADAPANAVDAAQQKAAAPAQSTSATGAPATALDRMRYIADDLPLLPPGIATAARPPELTKAVFAFAARRPDVLNYMPCFCGCERGGHRGNHDCFVAKRDAQNKVVAWEPHGLVCEVCIDVGAQAMQMTNAGASLAQIRDAIEKKYAGANYHTPTPHPPHKGGTN